MNKYIDGHVAAVAKKKRRAAVFCYSLQMQLTGVEKCPCGCCKVSTAFQRSGPRSLKCEQGFSYVYGQDAEQGCSSDHFGSDLI